MRARTLRTFALSLAGAHEEPHFERTSFRVGKKIFATMTSDGEEAMVRVFPTERLEALLEREPEVFFSYGGWTRSLNAIGVRLGKVDPGLMRELVTDSWARVAPKPNAKAGSKARQAKPTTAPGRRRPRR